MKRPPQAAALRALHCNILKRHCAPDGKFSRCTALPHPAATYITNTEALAANAANVRLRPIAVIRREPKAYGADIPLPVVREPPLSGCCGWKADRR
jgi:hypothetical protein